MDAKDTANNNTATVLNTLPCNYYIYNKVQEIYTERNYIFKDWNIGRRVNRRMDLQSTKQTDK